MTKCEKHDWDRLGIPCAYCEAEAVEMGRHPLFPFFLKVMEEYDRGQKKYGPWSQKDSEWQKKAVKSECLEWEATTLSEHHEEREMEELTHLANVSGKRWTELKKYPNIMKGEN